MTQDNISERLNALEAQLENQQETIDRQQERIDEQAAIIADQRDRLDDPRIEAPETETADDQSEDTGLIATRRGVLTAGGVLGLMGLGTGTASADASGQIGTSTDPLQDLYTATLDGGSTGLTITTNSNGNLDLDAGSGNKVVIQNGNLDVRSATLTRNTKYVSGDTTINSSDYLITVDPSSTSNVYLPSSPIPGEEHVFKLDGAGGFDIDGNSNGIDNDGVTSKYVDTDDAHRKVIWDDNISQWMIISHYG